MKTIYEGFYSNESFTTNGGIQKIATALNGQFYNGYTEMRMSDLHEDVEGAHMLLDVNLKELVKYKQELIEGKRVNIYISWTLSEDREDIISCNLEKVEVVKGGVEN